MVKRIYKPISIEDFIIKIRNPLAGGQVENIFLHGFCYYFSIILKVGCIYSFAHQLKIHYLCINNGNR